MSFTKFTVGKDGTLSSLICLLTTVAVNVASDCLLPPLCSCLRQWARKRSSQDFLSFIPTTVSKMDVSICPHDSLDTLGSHIKILVVTLEGGGPCQLQQLFYQISHLGEFNGCKDSTDESHEEYCSTCMYNTVHYLHLTHHINLFTCTYMYTQHSNVL